MPNSKSSIQQTRGAKKRVRAAREQVAAARLALEIPQLATIAETAAWLRVSKPTVVRLVRRGELEAYRPSGIAGGAVLIVADSIVEHIRRNTYGGAR